MLLSSQFLCAEARFKGGERARAESCEEGEVEREEADDDDVDDECDDEGDCERSRGDEAGSITRRNL